MTHADPYGSSWLAATKVASPQRPALAVELDIDVCVIGAGLAGLTLAYEVARRGWSVVVLETKSVAWNASGRNTGFVLPGYSAELQTVIDRVGLDHAKKLWALSQAGVEYVRTAVAETAMPGADLTEGAWLHVSKTDRVDDMAARHDLLQTEFNETVEAWPAVRVRESLNSTAYFDALYYPRAFSINPLN